MALRKRKARLQPGQIQSQHIVQMERRWFGPHFLRAKYCALECVDELPELYEKGEVKADDIPKIALETKQAIRKLFRDQVPVEQAKEVFLKRMEEVLAPCPAAQRNFAKGLENLLW